MNTWLIFETDGRCHQVYHEGKGKPVIQVGQEAVKVDRHTLDPHCEHFDRKSGKWVMDHAKRADTDEQVRVLTMSMTEMYYELLKRIEKLEKGK